MKILTFSDLHLGLSPGHDRAVWNSINEISKFIANNKSVSWNIIIPGDLFHRFNSSAINIYDCENILHLLTLHDNVDNVFAIAGNHDVSATVSMLSVFKSHLITTRVENLRIFDLEFGYYRDNDLDLLFAPYQKKSDYMISLEKFIKSRADLNKSTALITHANIPGAKMGSEQEIENYHPGTLPLVNDYVDLIISGHIHKQQIIDYGKAKVIYPGSVSRVSFSEEKEAKGFIIYNSANDDIKFNRLQSSRTYKTITLNWNGRFVYPAKLRNVNPADCVRVRIDADVKFRKNIDKNLIIAECLNSGHSEAKVEINYKKQVNKNAKKILKGISLVDQEKLWVDENVSGVAKQKKVLKVISKILSSVGESIKKVEMNSRFYITGVKINSYQSITDVNENFNASDCIGIIGNVDGDSRKSNGSGKSTFLEAIRFGFYGITRFRNNKNAIQFHSKKSQVDIWLSDGKTDYRVCRILGDSSNNAMVFHGENCVAKGAREVNEFVHKLTGMDYSVFEMVAWFGNSRYSFINATPMERAKLFQRPLSFDRYEKAKKIIVQMRSELRAKIGGLRSVCDLQEDKNCAIDLDKLNQNLMIKNVEKSTLESALKAKKLELSEFRKNREVVIRLEEIENDIERNDKLSGKLRTELAKMSDGKGLSVKHYEKSVKSLSENINAIKTNMQILKQSITTIDEKVDELADRKAMLTVSSRCPVCKSPLEIEHKKTLLNDIERNLKDSFENREKYAEQIKSDEKTYAKKVSELKILEKQFDEIQRENLNLKSKQNDLKVAELEFGRLKDRQNTCVKKLAGKSPEVFSLRSLSSLEKQVELHENKLDDLKDEIREMQGQVDDLSRKRLASLKVAKLLKTHESELEIYDLVYNSFNSTGIPLQISKSLIQEMNKFLPEIISEMGFWQSMEIDLSLVEDGEGVVVNVKNNNRITELDGLSNGEKETVVFLIQFAYRRIIEQALNSFSNFVFVDEAIDNLDDENIRNIIDYFNRSDFQVFAITHRDLKEMFSRSIILNKVKGVSYVS